MALEVVVLGSSGTFPTPGSACSGYLLRSGDCDVWVDAGSGTFANLQRHADFHRLRALVLTHLHTDHITDFYPLYYALRYSLYSRGPRGLEVYAPAGAEGHLVRLISLAGSHGDFGGHFAFKEISDGSEITLDGIRLLFARSVHPIETLAVRAEAGGRALVYSADTGPGEGLVELARGAEVMICEAALQAPKADLAEVHLTAEQAGEIAARAGVGRLVLAHLSPGLDPEVSAAQARRRFSGEILLAADNLRIQV